MGVKEKVDSRSRLNGAERDREMDDALKRDFSDPQKKARRKRNVRIGFVVCLAVLLISSLLNWGVITEWGSIRIDRINVNVDDGATYSALVYTPESATDEAPAPAVLCYHGNSGSARNHESWAMEFARRGFVVVSPDLYGAGDSQSTFDEFGLNGKEGKIDEAEFFYRYVADMPNVDADNIIASGHSAGGEPAMYVGGKYGAKAVLNVSGAPSGMFVDGFDAVWQEAWKSYKGNYLYLIGNIETVEGGGRNDVDKMGLEALSHYPEYAGITEFERNTLYGSFEEGDAVSFIVEQNRVHEAAFVSTQTIGHLLDFAQSSLGETVPNYIDADDQVWLLKDYIGLFGIFAFVTFLCSLTLLLIEEIPVFASVRRPLAPNKGFRGTSLVVATVIGICAPYLVLKTDAFGIIGGKAYANLDAAGFEMGYANMGFGVVVGLTLVCLLGCAIYILAERGKKQLSLDDFGLVPPDWAKRPTCGERMRAIIGFIVRSAFLAAVVIAIGWAYVQLQLMVLGTDFYAWFFGVKDIPLDKVPYYANYLVVFILCFVVLSIDMNVIRRLPSTGNETRDLIIGMAANLVVGVAVVVVFIAGKWALQTMGSPADANMFWKIAVDITRILGLPAGMTVATTASTFIYKKTGNMWLCAFLVGTVACLMGVLYGQTRFHF